MKRVDWSDDVRQAEWISERLAPFDSGQATSVVPGGFAAYARILHPARDLGDRRVSWSQVAAGNGLELRPDTQFPQIALLPPTAGPSRQVVAPDEGTLCAADAAALIDVLRRRTPAAQPCWFALWDGFGWDAAAWYVAQDGGDGIPPPDPEDPIPRRVRDGPRVDLPHRTYVLYRGALEDALAFVEPQGQTPNLWWPQDRAWCVASELDLGWTYVGGSQELIDEIIGSQGLEALPSEPTQSHHLRFPHWLEESIDSARDQVWAGGRGRVETSLGTASAIARRPGRLRAGGLWTTSVGPDGDEGNSSWTKLRRTDEEWLREVIRHDLSQAVLGLLG